MQLEVKKCIFNHNNSYRKIQTTMDQFLAKRQTAENGSGKNVDVGRMTAMPDTKRELKVKCEKLVPTYNVKKCVENVVTNRLNYCRYKNYRTKMKGMSNEASCGRNEKDDGAKRSGKRRKIHQL